MKASFRSEGKVAQHLSRRSLIKASGAIGAALIPAGVGHAEAVAQMHRHDEPGATAAPTASSNAQTSGNAGKYLFLNADEASFVEAAVGRLIPVDDKWGGAIEAGVPDFIDKQLGGAWGAGERLYRSGPWRAGAPTQGYQLPFTPAELFRTAIKAINNELKASKSFAAMSDSEKDEFLHGLERGGKDLDGIPSDVFFSALWAIVLEGFFSDPVYGGNRDMVAWRMIGFPGAYANYYDLVDQHGMNFDRKPTSLAEDVHGHVHVHPDIPASLP